MRLPAILSTLAVFAASAVPAFPQFRFATTGRCAASGAATIDVSPVLPMTMIPVTGSPYSAVATDKSRYEAVKWRDSAGRVRTEIRAGSGGQPAPCNSILVQIEDPVAGYFYVLDPVNQIAHRLPLSSVSTQATTTEPVETRTTSALSNEPAPSLFRAPAKYKIVDETGPFTVDIPGYH